MKALVEKPRPARNGAYSYLIGRIRVLEKGLLSGKILDNALRAPDLEQTKRVLSEVPLLGEMVQGMGNTLQSIDDILTGSFWETLHEIGLHRSGHRLTRYFTLGLDSNALKLVIKRHFANVKGSREYPATVSWPSLIRFVSGEGREYLPDFFRQTAEGALAVLENTGNVQMVEAAVDRCFLQEVLYLAGESESPVIKNWLIASVMFSFIRAALRARFQERKSDFLDTLYCENPYIKRDAFQEMAVGSKEKAWEVITGFGFTDLFDREGPLGFDPMSLAEMERSMDNYLMRFIRPYRIAAFGPEPVFAFLYARYTDTKNLRILLEGKFFGIDEMGLKQKIRESFYE